METDIQELSKLLKGLTEEQVSQLKRYYELLIYFNEKINLVSKSTIANAAKQHFADCVLGIQMTTQTVKFSSTVYDLGSGNGFPGIVLSIMYPDLPIALVERDVRKAEFLKHVVGDLKLSNTSVLCTNIEKLDRQTIQFGITRALGSISRVLIQVNSLFKSGGVIIHFKTDNWSSEIASCPTQIFMSWDMNSLGSYELPESNTTRYIVQTTKK